MNKLWTTVALSVLMFAAFGSRRADAVCGTYYDAYGGAYTYDPATGQNGCQVNPHPTATKHVIYLHGRSMKAWVPAAEMPIASMPADWDVRNPSYNGNKRLADSTTNTAIKNHLQLYCRPPHTCVVVAFSAGMNRFLYANTQLIAAGTPLTQLLYVHAMGSNEGGSPLARYTSKWYKAFFAKLFGKDADIDKDIHDTMWTPATIGGSTTYSAYHNNVGKTVWTVGVGLKDTCIKIKILFFKKKMCGNKEFPSKFGDGAVTGFSACGYNTRAAINSCNITDATKKWTGRLMDTNGGASYSTLNHAGIFATGSVLAAKRATNLIMTVANTANSIPATLTETDCSAANDECDMRESDGIDWFNTYQKAADEVTANYRPHSCDGSATCSNTSYGVFTKQGCYVDSYTSTGYCRWKWVKAGVTKYCDDFSMTENFPSETACHN